MPIPFLSRPAHLDAKIAEWQKLAGPKLRVDHVTSFSGHKVYALTLTDPSAPLERKRRHYFAQPHAHEPGATAGMMDVIEQLVTGRDLAGRKTALDVGKVLSKTVLTFNPIGNPRGREAAPVDVWDGVKYTNDQFWCWMRGEDPANPGKMWLRLGLWDVREHTNHPDPIGIVYEPVDKHRWVEPNRSHLSSYFRLFFKMDAEFHYQRWLDLHQMEFVRSDRNCMVLLPIRGLASGAILEEDTAWGHVVCNAWKVDGYRPIPEPRPLGYSGVQAEYFRKNWGALHKRMNILSTEVKNNAVDAPPDFQLQAQSIAIVCSIERIVQEPVQES